ncbi:MAG: RDD family protein [Alphaproteobacteria bacterium]|nr:MAG: RDD family protein [Alphaproteobacteria bacterium]
MKSIGSVASQGKRFANYILDLIFYLIFCVVIGFILGIIFAIFSPSLLNIFNDDNKILNYLIGFIAIFIYYSTFEALTGKTLAKFITRTKVINESGSKPNYKEILLRTLCRFIPFEAFSFLGDDNSGWHDQLSKTRVIEE